MFSCQVLFHWFSYWSCSVLVSSPKYTYRENLVNKAVATKAWSEKRKQPTTPLSLSLSLTKPQRNSQAPDEADKVADQLLEMVSGPHNAVDREYTLTEVQRQNISTAAVKTSYTAADAVNLDSTLQQGNLIYKPSSI